MAKAVKRSSVAERDPSGIHRPIHFRMGRGVKSGWDETRPLLATYPERFFNGKGIVRWEDPGASGAFEVTNAGLSITIPILRLDDKRALAVLNCGVRGRLAGPLGLQLKASKARAGFFAVSQQGKKLVVLSERLKQRAHSTAITTSIDGDFSFHLERPYSLENSFQVRVASRDMDGLSVTPVETYPGPHVGSEVLGAEDTGPVEVTLPSAGLVSWHMPSGIRLNVTKSSSLDPENIPSLLQALLDEDPDQEQFGISFDVVFQAQSLEMPGTESTNSRTSNSSGGRIWTKVAESGSRLEIACASAVSSPDLSSGTSTSSIVQRGVSVHAKITQPFDTSRLWRVDIEVSQEAAGGIGRACEGAADTSNVRDSPVAYTAVVPPFQASLAGTDGSVVEWLQRTVTQYWR